MIWATACFLALAANAPPAALVMVDQPVTVAVDVPEKARHAKVVFLRLEGVVMRRDAPAVWNIFWEMPEANVQTSVDDVHFAGYVTSVANSGLRDPKPVNFTVELPAEAVLAAHRLRAVRFTFVPVRKLPEGGVTITSLRLE
jgi:hypothetical protein